MLRKTQPPIYWAAAASLLLFVGIALAESTGVTNLAATVIRIVRGDGTLVIEVDDPNIQVLLDGDEIAITGAGPKELRLRPGQHELQTVKDGQPAETKLVTITKGGRDVVKVSREAAATPGLAAPATRLVWDDAETSGGPSLDGRYFTFMDWTTGDIAVRDLATGKNRRITNKGSWTDSSEYGSAPILSADGKSVFYTWYPKNGQSELRTISFDGGAATTIYAVSGDVKDACACGVTPDGKHILARLDRSEDLQIALITVADGAVRVLKSLEIRAVRTNYPKLSFDGRFAAYTRRAEPEVASNDLFLIDMATGVETRLTDHLAIKKILGWTPDGQRLLFGQEREKGWDAWMIRVADGQPQGRPVKVKSDIGNISPFHFTRDGALYFSVDTSNPPSLFTGTIDLEQELVTVTPLAAEEFNVTETIHGGHWSPDGEYLAYEAVPFGRMRGQIRVHSLKTGPVRVLKPDLMLLRRFQWSPDGKFLLSGSARRSEIGGIYQLDAESGALVSTIDEQQIDVYYPSSPVWAPDQRGIYYANKAGIVYHDLQTHAEREILPRQSFSPVVLEISPDGRQLAAIGREKDSNLTILKLIPVDGTPPRDLAKFEKGASVQSPEWTRDGQGLVFGRTDGKAGALWYVSTKGGEPRRLRISGANVKGVRSISIHPDGKQIALTRGSAQKSQIWVLENFLPPLDEPKPATAPISSAAPKQ